MTTLSPSAEFDREFETERGRWLRRRFVWFCGLMFLLDGLFFLEMLGSLADGGPRRGLERVGLLSTGALLAMYLGAAVRARRRAPGLATVVRWSIWLTVLDGASSLLYFTLERRLNVGLGVDGPYGGWAASVVVSMLLVHLIPCLLIPWSLREALRPAVVLFTINTVVVASDVLRGLYGAWPAAGMLALNALVFTPGALICWVRYSRFRQIFTWQFESGKYRRLQGELASARRVHESCLPPLMHEGPIRLSYVYEPMRQIGGDLLFVHPPKGEGGGTDWLSAVVLDVTGHGIAAALTVNRLVGELERLFAENPATPPGEVLRGLNRYVTLTLARHQLYATALCVRVDAAGGEIEWANGGHPPAYLRRGGGEVQVLDPTAPMLGVLDPDDFDPAPQKLPFSVGDVVLAYTDGASEACNGRGEQIGTAGVLKLFASASSDGKAPTEWPAMILREVSAHRGHDPEDDTLIVTIAR